MRSEGKNSLTWTQDIQRGSMKVHVCESVCVCVFLGAIRDRESDEGQQ